MLLSQGAPYHQFNRGRVKFQNFYDQNIHVPGTGQSLAWLRDGQGCEGHWPRVPRQDQTLHTRNQDVPMFN